MTQCIKCNYDKEGIESLAFKGEIWNKIRNSICKDCWSEWENDMQIKVMNEYKLDLSNEKHRNYLTEKMKEFLSLN
tara:strand:- start:1510 stop:1737 length:228 start_codon:yes stop_codon:yes gene_type:complete